MSKRIGFIGLGDMGRPMVHRLLTANRDIVVWTRSKEKLDAFHDSTAIVADNAEHLFELCDTVIVMLANAGVLDTVLQRGSSQFEMLCKDHTLIQMGTTPPEYSRELEADILRAGGRYAEIPVSGSSIPAAKGELVAMQAGDPQTLAAVQEIIAPLVASRVDCGPVPNALQMKLAVNTCLIGAVYGLIEGTNLARECGLDLQVFQQVLEAGQLNSPVLKMKIPKLVEEEFSAQGSVYQALANLNMMKDAGAEVGAPMPIVETARKIQQRTLDMGMADLDMVAAIRAYQELNQN